MAAIYGPIKRPIWVKCLSIKCGAINRASSPTPAGRIVCPTCGHKDLVRLV